MIKVINNTEERKLKLEPNNNSKLIINKPNYLLTEYKFESIQNEKYKILFLINNNNIFVGVFSQTSFIDFQRLLLFHVFIALINFKGDLTSFLNKLNTYEEYNKKNFNNLKEIYNKHLSKDINESNAILELLIFEYYFLKTIILHFSKVFNEIFKKEDFNLKQTKFKNLYLLDVSNLSVILDMNKLQGVKNQKKNKKYYKFTKLFEEILYHSNNMYSRYLSENEMKYASIGSDYRFVKLECTSTYPRLLFLIKFIPILKGIVVIHIYSQKRISRNHENNIQLEQGLNFKEVDLLFGSFIKENPHFEFKYGAPKKLENVEKFMTEFYLTARSGFGLFHLVNIDKKYKYINYNIIEIINSYQISNDSKAEQIFINIDKIIKQKYEEEQKNTAGLNDKRNENEEIKLNYNNDNRYEMKKLDNLFLLNKEKFYNYFFQKNTAFNDNTNNISNKSNSILKEDNKYINSDNTKSIRKKVLDMEDNIYKNINVNELIKTDRQLLVNQNNKSLSFYNSKDIYNRRNNKALQKNEKNEKLDNFSMISEIKTNEQFEINNIYKKHNQIDNNKEDTNEIISDSSSKEEKQCKLTELLELTNSNRKNVLNKIDISKIKEDFKENELTKRDNNSSRIIQYSTSKKKRGKISVDGDMGIDSGTSRNSLLIIKDVFTCNFFHIVNLLFVYI